MKPNNVDKRMQADQINNQNKVELVGWQSKAIQSKENNQEPIKQGQAK